MSLATDLLDQASILSGLDPMEPKQASLRRAISAAYYSLFHLLIDDGARRVTANPLIRVCNTFVDRQSLRHSADYNTAISFKSAEVVVAISRAQAAHQDWALLNSSDNATVFLLQSAKLLPDR